MASHHASYKVKPKDCTEATRTDRIMQRDAHHDRARVLLVAGKQATGPKGITLDLTLRSNGDRRTLKLG